MSMRPLQAVAWTASGQVLAAIGTLLGTRWITSLVSPDIYGETTLLIGVAGLVVNVLCTPLTQAVIHEFPGGDDRSVSQLTGTFSATLLQVLVCAAVIVIAIGAITSAASRLPWWSAALLMALAVCDSWRAGALALWNAAHRHQRYAMWVMADACFRPILAIAAIYLIGASTVVIMLAYLLAAALLLPLARQTLTWKWNAADAVIRARFWKYALPLAPLGLIGWITGMADRYVIGGTLSFADAGIYAAAAGLASRPLLMLGTAIELVIRPRYQHAVSTANVNQARRLLQWWLIAVLGGGSLFVGLLIVAHDEVANLLLGPTFRSGSILMPWIAAGYVLLIASYVFERVCYAHARTRRVLSIQITTAMAAIVCLFAGAYSYGLIGAAMAVPAYYSIQLIAAIRYAWVTQRESLGAPAVQYV